MHGFAVYVKERLPFAQDLSLKTLQILNYVFDWLYFTQCLTFFLYQPPSSSLCTIFYSISSNIDEVFSINTSANVFALETLTSIHHKDWLTYSGGTDRPGELGYNFSISNDLTQMVNFPTQIPDCDSHSPALLDLFLFF